MQSDVRLWHKADAQSAPINVCFEGNIRHDVHVARCLLMTHSDTNLDAT